jgi:glycosyltransferase involved in cell wall biosynthesis
LKARATHWLARRLEPLALRHVDGLTSVAPGYLDGVFARHPRLREVPCATMPIGGEATDHEFVESTQRQSAILSSPDLRGKRAMVYAGAFLPRARETVETLFRACGVLRRRRPELADAARFVFVGTGAHASDPSSGHVLPIAARTGVADLVVEVANRQPYLEVLALLRRAHGIMILGSSEPHYTPSKVFQALHARRPILAVLHQASTAVDVLHGMAGVELIAFSDDRAVTNYVDEIAAALARMLESETAEPLERSIATLDRYSARAATAQLAACLDDVCAARHADRPPA